MDDGSFAAAILFWLSPILGPVLAVGLLVVVLPLFVGVLTALVVLVKRIVEALTESARDPETDSAEAVPAPDPWTQLTALSTKGESDR